MSDQWLVLRGVCELRKREKKTSYLVFLDVSKAHNIVWREGLWGEALWCREEVC